MTDDLYSLRWNDFYANILSAFKSLKENEDFVDVTIACEGGRSLKAHKLVLSACSPFFRHILKDNPCSHPIIILKDVPYEEMESILNFMYHGEVQITQEDLTEFLRTAQSLQIKGLTDIPRPGHSITPPPPSGYLEVKLSEEKEETKEDPVELDLTKKSEKEGELGSDASNDSSNNPIGNKPTSILIKALEQGRDKLDHMYSSPSPDDTKCEDSSEDFDMRFPPLLSFQGIQHSFPGPSSLTNSSPDGNFVSRRNLELRVRATDPRPCPKCCKIYRSAHTLRTHLEDKHTVCPGYRCVLCGTVAKSRNSLHSHMSRQHRGISTKDLPVVPMPAPFDPKLASKLLSKAGLKFEGVSNPPGDSPPSHHRSGESGARDSTGSAILDTYLQFIAENSIAIGGMYGRGDKMEEVVRDVD